MRQNGLRARDLDGLGVALLDNWSRAQAKVELCDRYFDEHGFLDPKGTPRGAVGVYFCALNSAARTLAKLDAHLRARTAATGDALATLIEEGGRIRAEAEGSQAS